MNINATTDHYKNVRQFCKLANQAAPEVPTMPDRATAKLRAALILEEALETVRALGMDVVVFTEDEEILADKTIPRFPTTKLAAKEPQQFVGIVDLQRDIDLEGIADGCADISVVTTGTLVACGLPDKELLELVDQNNLDKFGPGHSYTPTGKLQKPPGHKPPNITGWLAAQRRQTTPFGAV